ncbi:MAG: tRNA (adenosine(37)-N6)-threonylcarbamoyltransferase complex ATPase subunit type 1 TsaE [Burkholderiales bacterium]|jgi:tRNA threonylcarbamoyladenosine biosynthesis protein TsaE
MTAPAPIAAPSASCTVALADEAATAALAARLAPTLAPGLVVWLVGGLGAGKTTLVRGLLSALGHTGAVRSPTFTLLEPYNLPRFPVYHFDFYRFSSPDEWRDAGFDEYFRGDGACLVEWPELAGPALPAPDLQIALDFAAQAGPDGERGGARIARLEAHGDAGRRCLSAAAAAS